MHALAPVRNSPLRLDVGLAIALEDKHKIATVTAIGNNFDIGNIPLVRRQFTGILGGNNHPLNSEQVMVKSARLFITLGAVAIAAPGIAAGPAQIDPKCLSTVPWEVDASGPIQVFGCRPAAAIPAPDAQGWTVYHRPKVNGTDAGYTRAKIIKIDADGTWHFSVQDSGGGGGVFPYTVSGKPNAKGILMPPTVKVVALPAN